MVKITIPLMHIDITFIFAVLMWDQLLQDLEYALEETSSESYKNIIVGLGSISVPYIRGATPRLAVLMIRSIFGNVKEEIPLFSKFNIIYKIPCQNCDKILTETHNII